jgi:hypothetical protein
MFVRVGAEGGEAGYMLSGVVNIRGAMARRPRLDPSILIHRDPHAWVGHVAASAASHTTPLVD